MAQIEASENVYVRDLPGGLDESGVNDVMSAYGSVQSIRVLSKLEDDFTAALCLYSNADEASVAVESLNGNLVEGSPKPIQCRFATKGGGKGGKGGGGGGGGFSGGKGGGGGWGNAQAHTGAAKPWAPQPQAAAPAPWKTAAPLGQSGGEDGGNIYIRDLPGGLDDNTFREYMSDFGTVVSVRLLSQAADPWTAGLVRFSTAEEAQWAIDNLNGVVAEGHDKPIQARLATKGKGKGKDKGGGGGFQHHAVAAAPSGGSRFSPYEQPKPASGGFSSVIGKGKSKGKGKIASPSTSYKMSEVVRDIVNSGFLPGGDGKDRSMLTEVYVCGLPADCSSLDLYEIMCTFGQIRGRGVTAMMDKMNGTCKGFGFVDFLSADSANLAIETLNGAVLPDGQPLKVEIKKPGKGFGKGGSPKGGGLVKAEFQDAAPDGRLGTEAPSTEY